MHQELYYYMHPGRLTMKLIGAKVVSKLTQKSKIPFTCNT